MTLTQKDFLQRATKVHGDRFDYSRSTYTRKHHKVAIICPVHGEFWQRAENHWNGAGCLRCTEDQWGRERRRSLDDFVLLSRQVHGEHYDYGLVEYRGTDRNVKIGCETHGVFQQSPSSHLKGHGCPRCGGTAKLSTADFVQRARAMHGSRYAYERTRYVNMSTKVTVTCPKEGHGDFRVLAKNHLYIKNGCPKCRYSKGEAVVAQWLNRHGIVFEPQKSFPTCRYKKPLHFDFHIPCYGVLIEYDGELHFESMRKCSGPDLDVVAIRDGIKDEWCRTYGIDILRINYIDKVDQVLRNFFVRRYKGRLNAFLDLLEVCEK